MNHERAFELMAGYVDGELGLSEVGEFEHHLADCALCQRALAQQLSARSCLKLAHLRVETPEDLTREIEAALSTYKSPPPYKGERHGRANIVRAQAWGPVGAIAIAAAVLSWCAGLHLSTPSSETLLSQELVDSHIRSLQVNHLFDVISTDQHTVKPWFNGKLDYAPPVVDLAQQGYPLVGGRLDLVGRKPVAVMIYRYKLHPINLYVWPAADAGSTPQIIRRNGYCLAHWSDQGMNFWAVTDAGENELKEFVSSLRAHTL
jgi:anti-sigma factor RsiW